MLELYRVYPDTSYHSDLLLTMNTEDWKESGVTRQDVVRYIKMKDKLLVMMPWYTTPVECYIIDSVSNHDYIKVACSLLGHQWIKREQLDVVAILPPPPPPPKRDGMQPLTATEISEQLRNYTPPWDERL